jgi:hypothetical protein
MLNTVQQIGNGLGVAISGTSYFALRDVYSDRVAALFVVGLVGLASLTGAYLMKRLERIASLGRG